MKVLIAGGSGFMGSALASSLEKAGHEVWILSRRPAGPPHMIHWDGCTPGEWTGQL